MAQQPQYSQLIPSLSLFLSDCCAILSPLTLVVSLLVRIIRLLGITSMAEPVQPSDQQFLKARGRTLSPRVIVYDRTQETLEVHSKRDIDESKSTDYQMDFAKVRLDSEDYTELRISPRKKRLGKKVILYADAKTDRPTLDYMTKGEKESNTMLARLRLDRLGKLNQILRVVGQLTTIYVRDQTPRYNYCSEHSSTQSVDMMSS